MLLSLLAKFKLHDKDYYENLSIKIEGMQRNTQEESRAALEFRAADGKALRLRSKSTPEERC